MSNSYSPKNTNWIYCCKVVSIWITVFANHSISGQQSQKTIDNSSGYVVIGSFTNIGTRKDTQLESKIRKDLTSRLDKSGYYVKSDQQTRSSPEEKSAAGFLLKGHYHYRKQYLVLYGQIYDRKTGYLIDVFEIKDPLEGIVDLENKVRNQIETNIDLIGEFSERFLLKINTNPNKRERIDSIQEFVESVPLSSQMNLRIRPGKKKIDSEAFRYFGEQEVVSGTRTKIKLSEVPATIRVVTDLQIRQHGYRYLMELLRDLPGFDETFFQGLYGSIFMMRGLDAPENLRILVFIDGIPDNSISSGSAYIKHKYSLHNVKRVEVLYGPASSLYGANAFSGIINIITKNGGDIKNYAEAGAGSIYFKPETKRAAPNAYINIGRKFGKEADSPEIIISGHYIDSNGPVLNRRDTPEPTESTRYWWSDSYTASAIDQNYMVNLKAKWAWLEIGGWQSRDFNGQGTFATGASYSDDGELAYWNVLTNTVYSKIDFDIRDRFNEKLIISYRETSVVDGTDAEFDTFGEIIGETEVIRYRRPDREYNLDNPFTINWNRKMNTILGLNVVVAHPGNYNTRSLTYDNIFLAKGLPFHNSPDVDPNNKFQSVTRAGYLQHYWKFLDQASITLGYRYDTFHITGRNGPEFCGTNEEFLPDGQPNLNFIDASIAHSQGCLLNEKDQYYKHETANTRYVSGNPRIGLVYSPSQKFTNRLLYGEAFRAPTIREFYSTSSSRITNGSLEPEKMHSTQWDFLYTHDNTFHTELSLFYNYIEDVISLAGTNIHRPKKSSGVNLSRFQNAGKAQVYGYEAMLESNVKKYWKIYLNYTYQKSELFDVNDPNLLAHDLKAPDIVPINQTTICRQVLSDHNLRLYEESCGGYHGQMPRVAKNKINVGTNILIWQKLLFDIRLNWSDTRPNIASNPEKSVPAYTLVHFTVGGRDWPTSGLDINFKVYNLFDTEVNDPGFRNARGDFFPVLHPRPERYYSWEIHYKL